MPTDLAWSEFNPLWTPLSVRDPRRKTWKPEQLYVYDEFTWRNEARKTPAAFARAVTPEWQDFPHTVYVSNLISKFMRDELLAPNGKPAKRLFLTMPPRHGKSFLLSQHVPAWFLSLYPNEQVILTTYEANFAAKWGGKVRDIIETSGARFGLQMDPRSAAKNRWSLAKPHLGGMITAGMGGPITGEGGGLIIGDDWVKNSQEANSQNWRDEAWDWYNTTFKTRTQKDLSKGDQARQPKMLLLMTRWHDDDPMGRLLDRQGQGGAGDLVVVHLPALAGPDDPLGREEGEALCPGIMSATDLTDLRAEHPQSFEALYQGNPTPEEGGLFSKSHFRTWRTTSASANEAPGRALHNRYVLQTPEGAEKYVRKDDCVHYITADLAISTKTRADYTVFAAWALTNERDLLLISRFRDRIEEAQHLPKLQAFYDDLTQGENAVPIRFVGIENQSFGVSLIVNARRHSNMPIRELKADKDKFTRAIPAGLHTQAGKFYLPNHAIWAEEFIGECTMFDNGAHDDQVDVFAYAVEAMNTLLRGHYALRERKATVPGNVAPIVQRIADRNAKERRKRRSRAGF